MKILGIETSCDETAAAIVESDNEGKLHLRATTLATSLNLHEKTGGIIPEVAAREQVKVILPTLADVLGKINWKPGDEVPVDALAVTYGPGLIGSLLVGVETAKTLAYLWQKPLIPVNHLYGHIYANWITSSTWDVAHSSLKDDLRAILHAQPPTFPAVALVISGGHTDLVLMRDHGDLTLLGGTRDDAAGECFDKCARLIGYDYPGGPKISKLAKKGDPSNVALPRPMLGSGDYEFSFSGLKTAFLQVIRSKFSIINEVNDKYQWKHIPLIETLNETDKQFLYDLCASLEKAIVDVVVKKTMRAAEEYGVVSVVLGGGVSANNLLRSRMKEECEKIGKELFIAPPSLCTDNGAMIAAAAFFSSEKADWQTLTANPELYF